MKKSRERAEQYFLQIEQDMPDRPIFRRLHHFFRNKKDMVIQLVDTGAEDETIRAFIANTFGIMGGGCLNDREQPASWYEFSGGKSPHLIIQDKHFVTIDELQGQQLVNAFRSLYRIPLGGQLFLF